MPTPCPPRDDWSCLGGWLGRQWQRRHLSRLLYCEPYRPERKPLDGAHAGTRRHDLSLSRRGRSNRRSHPERPLHGRNDDRERRPCDSRLAARSASGCHAPPSGLRRLAGLAGPVLAAPSSPRLDGCIDHYPCRLSDGKNLSRLIDERRIGKELAAIAAGRPCRENAAIPWTGAFVDLCAHAPQENDGGRMHFPGARRDAGKAAGAIQGRPNIFGGDATVLPNEIGIGHPWPRQNLGVGGTRAQRPDDDAKPVTGAARRATDEAGSEIAVGLIRA